MSQIAPLSNLFSLVNTFVLTEDGVLPLPPSPLTSPAEEEEEDPDNATMPKLTKLVVQLVYQQVLAWRPATERDCTGPPHATFCLRSSMCKESRPGETACCCALWQDPDMVEVRNTNNIHATWAKKNVDTKKGVMLALTLHVDDNNRVTAKGRFDHATTNVSLWGVNEPCLLLIHAAGCGNGSSFARKIWRQRASVLSGGIGVGQRQ